jgi:hypothetical protein
MLSGLRGEDSIAELCRREGIFQNLYYRWSKEFLEAGNAGGHFAGGQGFTLRGQRAEGDGCQARAGKPAAQKKHNRGWGKRYIRYPAAENPEVIWLVGHSSLPVRDTLFWTQANHSNRTRKNQTTDHY